LTRLAPKVARRVGGTPQRQSVVLSQAQVDGVIREARRYGNMSILLAGRADLRHTMESSPEILEDTRLSRSLLSGLLMLAALPPDGSYVGNAELARTLAMPMSTAHRYITTLVAAGLVERDPSTRKYRLANAR
jgi:DNA-binding MarR family transcriptional regulator